MSDLEARSEVLFLYDVSDTNPNGDPLDENKPRIDEKTGTNIVTDVRLKRTIRDYLKDYKTQEIFVAEVKNDKGELKSKKQILDDMGIDKPEKAKELFDKYIDLRLFGSTIAVKKGSVTRTGPVQFKFGRSLHQVEPILVKGTTVMPSGESKKQGTFTEVFILPYSLIGFYGVVNENAAASTGLQEEDVDLMIEGIWNGTKNLLTRSKVGQVPRLLLQVVYKDKGYHIGELDKKVKCQAKDMEETKVRGIDDLELQFNPLIQSINENKDRIAEVRVKTGEGIEFDTNQLEVDVKNLDF